MGELSVDASPGDVLDERARRMALPLDEPANDGDLHLIVRAGGERVAVRMSALRSVVPPPPMTGLQVDGLALVGLVALSGEVVPVVELATLLGREGFANHAEPMLVVLDDAGYQLALKVDGVEGHETLRPHLAAHIDLSDSAAGGATLTTPVGGEGLSVLDVDALLADPRLSFSDRGSRAGVRR